MTTALAVPIAFGLDAVVGEPPRRLHPVAWFGRLVGRVDRDWSRPHGVGLAVAVAAPLLAATFVGVAVGVAAHFASAGGIVLAALSLFVTTSRRRLLRRSQTVIGASTSDLAAARAALPALVGRDPTALSPSLVRSAAVESAAENLADGLVAPLLAFAAAGGLGMAVGPTPSIAFAAAAAAWVKAVNTLDSMLGYPDKSHGGAAARLDDAVMWVPARVAAGLVALVAVRPRALSRTLAWLDDVPSPNGGWPMGTVATIADCRLEKPGVYVLNGRADLPDVATASTAVRTVAWAGVVAYVLATLVTAMGVVVWS